MSRSICDDDDDRGVFETSNALVSLNTTDGTISSVLFTGPVLLHPIVTFWPAVSDQIWGLALLMERERKRAAANCRSMKQFLYIFD